MTDVPVSDPDRYLVSQVLVVKKTVEDPQFQIVEKTCVKDQSMLNGVKV